MFPPFELKLRLNTVDRGPSCFLALCDRLHTSKGPQLGNGFFFLYDGVGCACVCGCVRAWIFAALRVASAVRVLVVVLSLPFTHVEECTQVPGVVCYFPPLKRRMQGVPLYCSGWMRLLTWGDPCVLRRSESSTTLALVPYLEESLTGLVPCHEGPVSRLLHPSREGCTQVPPDHTVPSCLS